MRKISTSLTVVNKRVLPGFVFGMLAFLFCLAIRDVMAGRAPLLILVVLFLVTLFVYALMRLFIFDLMDEVFLDGDDLVVRNRGDEARIPLSHVTNVSATILTNPGRITLTLSELSIFGRKITFSPLHRWWQFSRHPLAKELMLRAQEARRRTGSA
jgi:hypothetical protein